MRGWPGHPEIGAGQRAPAGSAREGETSPRHRACSAGAVRSRRDPVLVLGLACAAGALASSFLPWGPVGVSLGALSLARRGARGLALVALFVALACGVRAARAIAAFEAAQRAVAQAGGFPARCALEGEIASSPVRVAGHARVDVRVVEASCDGGARVPPRARVTIHLPEGAADAQEPRRGDRVSGVATLAPPQRFLVDELPDPRPPQARRGVLLSGGGALSVVRRARSVPAAIDRERAHARARIGATFSAEAEPMARAIVLGESDLTPEDDRAFRESGLAHLLAVSGAHLVVVVWGLVRAVRALARLSPRLTASAFGPDRVSAVIGIVASWIYADFAGASGSAVRAAWMTTAALVAIALERRPSALRALGSSIGCGVLFDPLAPFDVSFTLSALATAGLLTWSSPVSRALEGWLPGPLSRLAGPISASTCATVACAPVLLRLGPALPLTGVLANVVAVPVGEAIALPLCLSHGLLAPLPAAERGAAVVASGALLVVRAIARIASSPAAPHLTLPPPTAAQLAVAALSAFVAWGAARPRRVIVTAVVALLALELRARAAGAPRGGLRVTFLDVGQGDAALVDLPDGTCMLVDGGGLVGSPIDTGERVIAPLLRARRRRRVERVVLSHPHPDHYLGLLAGLAAVRVDEVWDTGQGEEEGTEGAYARVLARARAQGTLVLRPSDLCGARGAGGARVEVLAPCPAVDADHGPNDNSLVVRVSLGSRAVLFVGDAERHEEAKLVASGAPLRADVLKVGHHGSRTSTTAPFLAAVSPELAVVSVGARNRFGHPHPFTMHTLARARVTTLRTDRVGSVTVTTDGTSLTVAVFGDQSRSTTPM